MTVFKMMTFNHIILLCQLIILSGLSILLSCQLIIALAWFVMLSCYFPILLVSYVTIQFNSLFQKAMRLIGEYINIFTVHDIGMKTIYTKNNNNKCCQIIAKYGGVIVRLYIY